LYDPYRRDASRRRFLLTPAANAQREFWRTPFEAHRVIGPLYSVGTYDLSVFLLTTSEGHILINTGMEDSAPLLKKGIEDMGSATKTSKC